MSFLRRLLFLFGLLASFNSAFAAVPTIDVYQYQGKDYLTATAACNAYIAYVQPSNPKVSFSVAGVTEYPSYAVCRISASSDGSQWYDNVNISKSGGVCPANSVKNGSSCTCNSGYQEKDGQCFAPGLQTKEQKCGADFTYAGWAVGLGKYTEPWAINGYVPSGEQCDAFTDADPGGTGCKVYFSATGTTRNDNGTTTTTGVFRPVPGAKAGEGVPCSPTYEGDGKDVVAEKPKEKCDGYEGQVGGETKCIPNVQNNGVEWAKTDKSEKKADGTTVDTKVEQKCEKDKCTTTTTVTTKDAAGNTTSTSTSETKQDVALFCKENPDKCKNGKPTADGNGSGGGSGSGSGSGSGNGNGNGSCTGSDCPDNNGPGGPGKVGMPGAGAGEIGDLYQREYKQGPVQLWSEKSASLKDSGLGGLAQNLFPKVGDGGTPPTWMIDLEFGPLGNYGVRDIAPEPWLWSVIRAITILSALVVARKLVFGG